MKRVYIKLVSMLMALTICMTAVAPVSAQDSEETPGPEAVMQDDSTQEEQPDESEAENHIAVAADSLNDDDDDPDNDPDEQPEEPVKEAFTVDVVADILVGEMPVVVVRDKDGNELAEGEDYSVQYPDTEMPGMMSVIITGEGDYEGTIEKEFHVACDIAEEGSIKAIPSVTYSGKAYKPEPEVKYGGAKLKKGVDYTVEYADNIDAGTARVIVNGMGDYTGTLTASFKIGKAKNVITASNVRVNFSGKEQTVKIKVSTKDANAKITFDNARYHDGRAVIAFTSSGKAVIPAKFLKKEKVKIQASATKNYKAASKTITITGVVDEFPYKSRTHVYKTVRTAGNAVLRNLRARKTKFRVNYDITEYNGGADLMPMIIGEYVAYHQSKSYPFTLYEWTSPSSAYGVNEIAASYNGHAYGTLLYEKSYQMSKKKEDIFIAKIKKTLKHIGATSGSDYSKTKKIYKWITKNIHYAYSRPWVPDWEYVTAYKTFTGGKGICQGYARLMKAMCNITGVDCIYVEGDSHAWNLVKDGKKWYACDPTFDAKRSPSYWRYFMVPYNYSFISVRGHRVIEEDYLKQNPINIAK